VWCLLCGQCRESQAESYYATTWTARAERAGSGGGEHPWKEQRSSRACSIECESAQVNVLEESRASCRVTVRHCYIVIRHGCASSDQQRLDSITWLAGCTRKWCRRGLRTEQRIRRPSFQSQPRQLPSSCAASPPETTKAELKHSPGRVASLCLLVHSFCPVILLRHLENNHSTRT
jgi:hypothetical protein